jgi:hypothetical protein
MNNKRKMKKKTKKTKKPKKGCKSNDIYKGIEVEKHKHI